MKTELEPHAVEGRLAEVPEGADDSLNSAFQKNAGDAVNAIAAAEEVIALATAIAKKALDISLMHQTSSIELILQAAQATLATTEVAVQKTLMEAKASALKTLELARTIKGERPVSAKKKPVRSRQSRLPS
ncbi:hypothetical protein [Rhodoferax saidenbachensis]|nr:hypothetical protein [Rhodoferax saidenbachensis]